MYTNPDIGLFLLHVLVGLFFAVTGWRKLFNPKVHAMVWGLFTKYRVPPIAGHAVLWGEFLGGLGLLTGTLTQLAALGLIPIMIGAFKLSRWPEIVALKPDSLSMWTVKVLCNSEALLLIVVAALVFTGAGAYSLDRVLFGW